MKKIIIILSIAFFGINAVAQETQRSNKLEYSVYFGVGSSQLQYKFNDLGNAATVNGKAGVDVGANIAYNFNENWALVSGLGFQNYKSEIDVNNISGNYDVAVTNDPFNFRYTISNYKETQKANYLYIPVKAQYTIVKNAARPFDIFFAAGFKFAFPVGGKYDANSGNITTSGYYYYENQEYTNNPAAGFAPNQPGINSSGDIDFKMSTMLSAEAGLKFNLSSILKMHVGLYIDYGLNSIQKDADSELIQYQIANPPQFEYNSLGNTDFIESIKPLSFGVKLAVAF